MLSKPKFSKIDFTYLPKNKIISKAKRNLNVGHSYIPYENESCISYCIMKLIDTNC